MMDANQNQLSRNSFTIEELMFRNHWSRNFVYRLIAKGVLRTYKDGKRRRASARAEADAICRLEQVTSGMGDSK
jgi:hypothetical protein